MELHPCACLVTDMCHVGCRFSVVCDCLLPLFYVGCRCCIVGYCCCLLFWAAYCCVLCTGYGLLVVDDTFELTSSAYRYLLYTTTLLSGAYVQNGSGLSGSRLACVVPRTASIGLKNIINYKNIYCNQCFKCT
jgi:hypothetical protein